jgi:hypothetical protein
MRDVYHEAAGVTTKEKAPAGAGAFLNIEQRTGNRRMKKAVAFEIQNSLFDILLFPSCGRWR